MKLNEMRAISTEEPPKSGGKAVTSFVDFLNDMDEHYTPEVAQKIRACAAHFIKAGFSFGKVPHNVFETMGFFKGDMVISLPNKMSAKRYHKGVFVKYGDHGWQVSFAKAAKLDFPKLFGALEAYTKARAEVHSQLGVK